MILAILQARTSSTRLPGKVLLEILGRPMILLQVERIRRSQRIDKLVVATSQDRRDDELAKICMAAGVEIFRGNLDDVLDRFYQAASLETPEHVVRLTGDCPLADPLIIDAVVEYCLSNRLDYASNTIEPTYPDGLDVEVFTFEALKAAWTGANLPSQREHVTPFIYQHPEQFKIGSFKCQIDLSHLRWTVDEREDYELVKQVYEILYQKEPAFSSNDVLELLKSTPNLRNLNKHFRRNDGYQNSIGNDPITSMHD